MEIIEQLKTIVKPYSKNEKALDTFDINTDFLNDLQINSANLVDIILDIEEVFDVVIDNEDMQKMINVESTVAIISQKLHEK